MLYKLEVENFFCIRDPQVLDLSVDGKVPDPEGRYATIFEGADVRAPKVVALYGANASGKTTVLRARIRRDDDPRQRGAHGARPAIRCRVLRWRCCA